MESSSYLRLKEQCFEAVDLCWPLESTSTISWPGSGEGFQLCMYCDSEKSQGYFYAAGNFSCSEHSGTHVDAPFHFDENGLSVDALPLESLVADAICIDISTKCNCDRDYGLSSLDIEEYESRHGTIARGCIVVVRTGHGRLYLDGSLSYLGYDKTVHGPFVAATTKLSFPGVLESAALLLVERGVCAVGLDTASLDVGCSSNFIVHRVLLGNNIYGIENISQNIEKLPSDRPFTLMVFPMKIAGGSGAPARVVALL